MKGIDDRRLKAAGNPAELDRILQEECRRRVASKLAATLSFPDFRFPDALSAEQCTGDELAEIHAAMIPGGASVVDLTCGLGIDAFHIARRARSVLAIDRKPEVAAAVSHNASVLGLGNVSALNADCTEWLEETEETFDVAFIDPARRGENGKRLFSLHDCAPDVVDLLPRLLKIAPRVIIKMSPMLDISAVIGELHSVAAINVIGTTRECKELVADIRRDFTGEPLVRILTAGHPSLEFHRSQLPATDRFATEVKPGDTIGEPWPAVMKAASWGLLPGLPLHPDSHLWLNPGNDFPGKVYRVESVEPFSSSNLKKIARLAPEGSVAVRNLPVSADELRKRLKARESDSRRIIGTTLFPSSRVLIFASANLEMRE